MQISRECTPPYLPTGISNLLQPAQAEVVLGQRSTYLASWDITIRVDLGGPGSVLLAGKDFVPLILREAVSCS